MKKTNKVAGVTFIRYFCFAVLLLPVLSSCEKEESPVKKPDSSLIEIYFSSNRSGNYEIWTKKGDAISQLTDDKNYDSWWPRISPNKDIMLFYRSPAANKNNNYAEAELWSMDLDGTNPKRLISLADNDWKAQGVADWSPVGSQLVMAAIEGTSNRWHIYLTDSEGKDPVKISTRTSLYLDPSFSRDGSRIVFTAFPSDYNGTDLSRLEIFTMNIDGTDEKRLTDDTYRDHDPYWAPDGSEIAFESALDPDYLGVGKWALRAVRPDGQNIRNILYDDHINTLPHWSDDSKVLYFHRFVFGSSGFRLFKINKDGTDLEAVTTGEGTYDDTDIEVL